MEDFVNGSPLTHARKLEGNLLYIHGTGDDNVHYQNAEMQVNELIKHILFIKIWANVHRDIFWAKKRVHIQDIYSLSHCWISVLKLKVE